MPAQIILQLLAESLYSLGKYWFFGGFLEFMFFGSFRNFRNMVFWKPRKDYEKTTKKTPTARKTTKKPSFAKRVQTFSYCSVETEIDVSIRSYEKQAFFYLLLEAKTVSHIQKIQKERKKFGRNSWISLAYSSWLGTISTLNFVQNRKAEKNCLEIRAKWDNESWIFHLN